MTPEKRINSEIVRDRMPLYPRTSVNSAIVYLAENIIPSRFQIDELTSLNTRVGKAFREVRETVFGRSYEMVTSNDLAELTQSQQEITEWLGRLVHPATVTPYIPTEVKETHDEVEIKSVPELYGTFYPHERDDSVPHRYHLNSATGWPSDLSDQIGDLAEYYDEFFFLRHASRDSLWYTVHPDRTYELSLKFYGKSNEKVSLYKPPSLPLEQMPKGEFELIHGELQEFNSIKDTLIIEHNPRNIRIEHL